MKLRKLLGFPPKVGDKVKGYSDYGVQYDGVVVEKDDQLNGAWVKGEIKTSDPLGKTIKIDYGRFFVSKHMLRHK